MKGRKPIPSNLKLVTGSRIRKDRTNDDEPILPVKVPPAPTYLTVDETTEFNRVGRLLAAMRVMTEADVDMLALYAKNFIIARDTAQTIGEQGYLFQAPNGMPMPHPLMSIKNKAEDRCLKILAEFGMSPSSRTRVKSG